VPGAVAVRRVTPAQSQRVLLSQWVGAGAEQFACVEAEEQQAGGSMRIPTRRPARLSPASRILPVQGFGAARRNPPSASTVLPGLHLGQWRWCRVGGACGGKPGQPIQRISLEVLDLIAAGG
jgi:hypothetical protein